MLRPFFQTDLPDLIRIAGSRDIADTTISVPHPYTTGHADWWIQEANKETAEGKAVHFAVADPETDRLLGHVGLRDVDTEHLQAELSFWMDGGQAGKGFATEAARAVLAYGFSTLKLNRICAYHMARNPASGRILEKLGMRQEGHLRQRVIKWGQAEDVLLWAVLRNDIKLPI